MFEDRCENNSLFFFLSFIISPIAWFGTDDYYLEFFIIFYGLSLQNTDDFLMDKILKQTAYLFRMQDTLTSCFLDHLNSSNRCFVRAY